VREDAESSDTSRGAWGHIVAVNDRLWSPATSLVESVGEHMLLLGRAMYWLFKPPFRVTQFVEAAEFIGVQSILIVALIGLFVGMVFALQLTTSLRQFGAETFVGATLGLALTRELAPVFTSIVVAARAGAGMATELGSMRITEQIDALSTMAVNPIQFLVTPRVIAGILMVPLLAMLFNLVGMFGGYGVAVLIQNVDRGVFLENARWIVDVKDVSQGLIKATFFGGALALIS